uniref:PCI domain-containing protein n=1 Tax=Dunaliella tertiolecta TaxID=3047 RepID=A0A7S3RAB0_DUNTE|mmetsp:Transcript_10460/g.28611  ORF Transcript_10460/g.28611 Transcript_10460/m.28611 type:complete len:388 (-) Transcript_10460:365-1528(-)
MAPLDFLEALQAEIPNAAADITELASLYQRKLWHPLTVKYDALIKQADHPINSGDVPVRMFDEFISDFGSKINLHKFAQFAVHATKSLPAPQSMVDHLQSSIQKLEDMKLAKANQPILFLRMHVAQHKIELGAVSDAKAAVEQGKEQLESMEDVDPSVSASVYYVASLLNKATGDSAEFYRSSLMYLSFVSSETLPHDFKLRLAVDISLAALLGDSIYSFGQLLLHPIVHVLDDSPFRWLHELLEVFNAGDMHKYDDLCTRYAAELNSQPALVANERRLREKITLMCLMEMISSLPAESRNIALTAIAQRTKLDVDGVEFLLMKALSLHLIEGIINQVQGVVSISWVAPRVLTKPQIAGLKGRLDSWISKVSQTAMALEQETVGVEV